MDGFITFVFILILIFFILRLILPAIFRFFLKRMTGFNIRKQQYDDKNVAYKDGKTTIISHGEEKSEVPKDFGDYVDYEDIKNGSEDKK